MGGEVSQSRRMSALETCTNVCTGYVLAVATQVVVFPLFGLEPDWHEHYTIAAIFTGVSLVRSYLVRRLFA